MKLIDCSDGRHSMAILNIFNDAILHSTALYEYQLRKPDSMAPWFAAKLARGHPILGIERDDGKLLGFATYGEFRTRPAYKYSAEHSVYVQRDERGAGVGRQLLEALLARAEADGIHTLIGGIDSGNHASIALHQRLGFVQAGLIRQTGFKFGSWLDLALYQRVLAGPGHPVDG